MRKTRTQTELALALREIIYVLDQTIAYIDASALRVQLAEKRLSLPNSIRNGSLEASLLSFRILNDFLAPKGRDDDILAIDYGYNGQPFLKGDERMRINKHLAHLDWKRVVAKPQWPYHEMTRRAKVATYPFFLHVEKTLPALTDEERGWTEYALGFCQNPI